MRKITQFVLVVLAAVATACSTSKVKEKAPLAEILFQKEQGGAEFEFYEIFTAESEVQALLSDAEIKKKLKNHAVGNVQFVLLNMGQKVSGGYYFEVDAVEKGDTVELRVTKRGPKPGELATDALTQPMAIVAVNSTKKIVIVGI